MLSLIFVVSTVGADRDSEEYRLLKSWGMQFDTLGKLRFRPEKNIASKHSPWKPDLSAYRSIDSTQVRSEMLKPLVISSRNRPQPEKAINPNQ